MKNCYLILVCFSIIFGSNSFANDANHNHNNHTKQQFSVGSGVINQINESDRTINISHGPIPSLKWPSMTMDIAVSDEIDLSSLKEGQSVKFKIKLDSDDNKYRIFKIKNK